jgi:hypothetical protein
MSLRDEIKREKMALAKKEQELLKVVSDIGS